MTSARRSSAPRAAWLGLASDGTHTRRRWSMKTPAMALRSLGAPTTMSSRLAIGHERRSTPQKEGEPDVEPKGGPHHRSSSIAPARRSEAMLIYSMGVSVDGFIADRKGAFGWSVPSEEQFRFHLAQTRELGGFLCGRRLYETMLVWETDPSLRDNELGAAFADVWCAIPRPSAARSTASTTPGNSPRRHWPRRPLRRSTRPTRTSRSAAPAWPRRRSSSACSKAAHVPQSGRRRWRHAVPAAGHRRRPARPDRDQDVRLARHLRALRARPR